MNVNRYLRFCGFFALALLAISTIPSVANAQAYSGKFTLPFSARWGKMTLPAGEYTFTAGNLTATGSVVILHDGKFVGSVMVGGVSYDDPSADSSLIAVPVGNTHMISMLRLENLCAMSFLIPKQERGQIFAENGKPVLARVAAVHPDKA